MSTIMLATGLRFMSPRNKIFSRKKVLHATNMSAADFCRVRRKAKPSDSRSRNMAWISPRRWTQNRPSIKELKGPTFTLSGAGEIDGGREVKRGRLESAGN